MKKTKSPMRVAAIMGVSALAIAACVGCGKTADKKGDDSSSSSKAPVAAKAEKVNTTSGTVTTTVDMSKYDAGKVVRVWLPVAQDYDYQKVTDVKFNAPGAKIAKINKDSLGNKMLYIEWDADADPSTRKADLSFHATREEVTRPELKEDDSAKLPKDAKEALKGSKLVPVNDQVKYAANKIVKGKKTDLEKARAIYDWIIANMNRDESVAGCGQGDVCALLSTKGGKCTDINSVFVGLCRAVGIPAREQFGIRMNDADITKNQHCWAEFYLKGTGWVAADPADVLKAVLKNGWTKDQAETKEKAEYYWGGYDSERVQLSEGRDVTLNPAQSGPALNYFGYPYAEVDGDAVDYYDPANFTYSVAFQADAK